MAGKSVSKRVSTCDIPTLYHRKYWTKLKPYANSGIVLPPSVSSRSKRPVSLVLQKNPWNPWQLGETFGSDHDSYTSGSSKEVKLRLQQSQIWFKSLLYYCDDLSCWIPNLSYIIFWNICNIDFPSKSRQDSRVHVREEFCLRKIQQQNQAMACFQRLETDCDGLLNLRALILKAVKVF